MTKLDASSVDRDRISAFDKVSSLGLIGLGVMGLAEACGIAVQSILTVGGVGGNMLTFTSKFLIYHWNFPRSLVVHPKVCPFHCLY